MGTIGENHVGTTKMNIIFHANAWINTEDIIRGPMTVYNIDKTDVMNWSARINELLKCIEKTTIHKNDFTTFAVERFNRKALFMTISGQTYLTKLILARRSP